MGLIAAIAGPRERAIRERAINDTGRHATQTRTVVGGAVNFRFLYILRAEAGFNRRAASPPMRPRQAEMPHGGLADHSACDVVVANLYGDALFFESAR